MVSSANVTGSQSDFGDSHNDYFKRIANMNLNNPQIVGFGISNKKTYDKATQYAKGAIVGSAFINHLTENGTGNIADFIGNFK